MSQSEPTASRWYVVPFVEQENAEASDPGYAQRPKYADTEGIQGFAGTLMRIPSTWGLPFSGEHYVIRFYGTQQALDAIEAQDDAWTEGVDASREQIADFLNHQYQDSRSFTDWADVFSSGGPDASG